MKIIRNIIAIIFCVFVFCLTYYNQADILALAQHLYSNGKTTYNPFIGATIITAILYLIQRLIYHFLAIDGKWYAITYMPSFLLLIIINDISASRIAEATCWHLIFTIPLSITGLSLLLRIAYLKSRNNRWPSSAANKEHEAVIISMLLIILGIAITLICSNTSKHDHQAYHITLNQVKEQRAIEQAEKEQAERDSLRQIFIADSISAAKDSIRKEKLRRDSIADIKPSFRK